MNKDEQTTVNHFHEKLLKLKTLMKTKVRSIQLCINKFVFFEQLELDDSICYLKSTFCTKSLVLGATHKLRVKHVSCVVSTKLMMIAGWTEKGGKKAQVHGGVLGRVLRRMGRESMRLS